MLICGCKGTIIIPFFQIFRPLFAEKVHFCIISGTKCFFHPQPTVSFRAALFGFEQAETAMLNTGSLRRNTNFRQHAISHLWYGPPRGTFAITPQNMRHYKTSNVATGDASCHAERPQRCLCMDFWRKSWYGISDEIEREKAVFTDSENRN